MPPTSRWMRIGHHDPLEVDAVHPLGDGLERVLDLHAEALLDDGAGELTSDRLGAFADDRVDRLRERQARLEATGDDRQGLGQLAVELLDPPRRLEGQVEPGEHGAARPGRARSRSGCRRTAPGRRGRTPIRMPACRSSHSAGLSLRPPASSLRAILSSRSRRTTRWSASADGRLLQVDAFGLRRRRLGATHAVHRVQRELPLHRVAPAATVDDEHAVLQLAALVARRAHARLPLLATLERPRAPARPRAVEPRDTVEPAGQQSARANLAAAFGHARVTASDSKHGDDARRALRAPDRLGRHAAARAGLAAAARRRRGAARDEPAERRQQLPLVARRHAPRRHQAHAGRATREVAFERRAPLQAHLLQVQRHAAGSTTSARTSGSWTFERRGARRSLPAKTGTTATRSGRPTADAHRVRLGPHRQGVRREPQHGRLGRSAPTAGALTKISDHDEGGQLAALVARRQDHRLRRAASANATTRKSGSRPRPAARRRATRARRLDLIPSACAGPKGTRALLRDRRQRRAPPLPRGRSRRQSDAGDEGRARGPRRRHRRRLAPARLRRQRLRAPRRPLRRGPRRLATKRS